MRPVILRLVSCGLAVIMAAPLTAQSDDTVTQTAESASLPLPAPAPTPAQQEEFADADGEPLRIDILVTPREPQPSELDLQECEDSQDAGVIANEIVVCRRLRDDAQFRVSSDEDAEKRFAEETMNRGNPQAPEAFGIPNHGPTVATGCFIPPCPPPPAIFIDVAALPLPPAGSDADRIARGLPPIGRDEPANQTDTAPTAAAPLINYEIPDLSREESAEPADQP